MATLLEEDAAVAGEDTRIEGLLQEWNLRFEFDGEYPLKKIDAEYEDAQVRQVAHRAPRDTTEEFTAQMRGQLQAGRVLFPALVITHNGRLIDGNTRKAAAERNGLETFPAYLVKLDRPDQGKVLGAALNQMGGRRLSAEESFAAAEQMMRDGVSDEAIARTLGKSAESVRQYRREVSFRDAAERVGVADIELKRSAKRELATIRHDEPFREAVKVAADTKATKGDIVDMVKDLAEARSEHEELEVIEKHRQRLQPSGPPPPRKASHSVAKAAGRKVDQVLAISVAPAELAPAVLRDELEPKWRRLHELAAGVLDAFTETPPAETP